ncbi:MAG: O-antigen ligase family protein [Phycisphaerae bacterium]
MRYIIYITLLFAILPFVFTRPFFGLCAYYVVSILQPKFLCWRPELQDALIVGVPMIMGTIIFGARRIAAEPKFNLRLRRVVGIKTKLVRSSLFEPSWPILLFGCLVVYLILNRVLSPFPMRTTATQFRTLCKVMLVATLTTGLASDYRRVRILIIVVGLSAAFWAIKGGIKVVLIGPHQVYGKTYDNNLFALTSGMALPMVFYFGLSVKHARWRAVLLACSAFIILAIIGSKSRAGFLSMGVVLLLMAWNSRYRLRALFAVLIVGAVTLGMARQEIHERIASILAFREDVSASSRFETWHYAWTLLQSYPLTGVGFNQFETARHAFVGGNRAAHNIYLQNLAELGLLGNPIWLAILLGTLISLYRFMRRARGFPPEFRWAYYWSRGLLLGLTAFCIHGMFHNEEYFEPMFAIVGLNIALQLATERELRELRLTKAAEQTTRRREQRRKTSPRRRGRRRPTESLGPHPPLALHPGRVY